MAALGGTASEGFGAFSLLQLVHDEPQRQLAQALQEALRDALLLADGHRRSFEELRCAAPVPLRCTADAGRWAQAKLCGLRVQQLPHCTALLLPHHA